MNSEHASDEPPGSVTIHQQWLNQWAESANRINHLNTLVQRAIQDGSLERARALSERSRLAASRLFNQLLVAGAQSPASDPVYPFVFWHRGLACEALGQTEEARRQFDVFGQCLVGSNTVSPSHLVEAIRERFRQYDLHELYPL